MRKFIVPVIIVLLLAIASVVAYQVYVTQQRLQAIRNYQTENIGRGSLTAYIGATGTVRSNQTTSLAWETSGTVAQVNVSEGANVAADQVLATLKQTSLAQNVILAQADLVNAQKALDDLQQSTLSQVQAAQAISTTQQSVIEAQRAFDQYDEQKYKDDLEKARNDVVQTKDDLKTAQEDFDPYQDWAEDNETRKSYKEKLDDAQKAYDEAVRIYDLLVIEKSLAESNLALAQAKLADAQRDYERKKNGPDARDVAAQQARLEAAQATLDLAQIKAPFGGVATHVDVKPGDPAAPGKVVFRIDDLSRLLVDVRISEVDINRIAVGQQATLSFDAIQGKEYTGEVNEVSNVGVTSQGIVEFSVTILLTNPDEDVKPGMTAAVNIVVQQFENVMLVPNRAVRVMEGQRIVYIIQDNQLARVNITLGASSDTMSEVAGGGLQLGDAVVLNPPLVFDTNGPPPFARGR